MAKTMSGDDKRELERLEQKISKSQAFEMEAAYALRHILTKRLYKSRYSTFENYCLARWDIGGSRARKMIRSAWVMEILSGGDFSLLPHTFSVALCLSTNLGESTRVTRWGSEEVVNAIRSAWREALDRNPRGPTEAEVLSIISHRTSSARPSLIGVTGRLGTGVYIGRAVSPKDAAERLSLVYSLEQIDALIGELLTIARNGLSKAA